MRIRSGLAAALLTGVAACSSPPTKILTVEAAPPPPEAIRGDYRGLPVAVPAVHVPAMLDQAEFVSHVSAGQAKVDDFARWAAPLGVLARDALVRDLTARLPAGSVLPPGSTAAAGRAVPIDVTILSFDADAGGATMHAAFRRLPGGPVREAVLTAPGAADPVASAQAFGALLGQLADRIAADLPR